MALLPLISPTACDPPPVGFMAPFPCLLCPRRIISCRIIRASGGAPPISHGTMLEESPVMVLYSILGCCALLGLPLAAAADSRGLQYNGFGGR